MRFSTIKNYKFTRGLLCTCVRLVYTCVELVCTKFTEAISDSEEELFLTQSGFPSSLESPSGQLDFCEWDKSESQPGCSDLNVEHAISDGFDFNTPEENHLLLEGPPATKIVASSMPHEDVMDERKVKKRGIIIMIEL